MRERYEVVGDRCGRWYVQDTFGSIDLATYPVLRGCSSDAYPTVGDPFESADLARQACEQMEAAR